MAKFSGKIGFAIQTEVDDGVWEDKIIEKTYYGDITRNTQRYHDGNNKTLSDMTLSVQIGIVSDPYMTANLGCMRYVTIQGTRWNIESVDLSYPRIVLSIGGVYNGPIAEELS